MPIRAFGGRVCRPHWSIPAHLFRLVHFFDILAAVVFAVSGALVAPRQGLDVMGFMWLAVITGVGGGVPGGPEEGRAGKYAPWTRRSGVVVTRVAK